MQNGKLPASLGLFRGFYIVLAIVDTDGRLMMSLKRTSSPTPQQDKVFASAACLSQGQILSIKYYFKHNSTLTEVGIFRTSISGPFFIWTFADPHHWRAHSVSTDVRKRPNTAWGSRISRWDASTSVWYILPYAQHFQVH